LRQQHDTQRGWVESRRQRAELELGRASEWQRIRRIELRRRDGRIVVERRRQRDELFLLRSSERRE
jgi:hypothetical protein